MLRVMKIIHLSDLHISGTKSESRDLDELFKNVARKKPDHIVITGDITNSGKDIEYEQVIKSLKKHQLFSRDKLTVIPGNHDLYPCMFSYFSSEDELSEVISNPKTLPAFAKRLFSVIQNLSSYEDGEYKEALDKFKGYFSELFVGAKDFGNSDTGGFPYVKMISDASLVCVDSNFVDPAASFSGARSGIWDFLRGNLIGALYNISDNPLCSNGDVNGSFLDDALASTIHKGKYKIVLMHHYLYSLATVTAFNGEFFAETMGLYPNSRRKVIRLSRERNVDMILHGHWHITEDYWVGKNTLHVLNGGGIWDGTYNTITINNAIIVTETSW